MSNERDSEFRVRGWQQGETFGVSANVFHPKARDGRSIRDAYVIYAPSYKELGKMLKQEGLDLDKSLKIVVKPREGGAVPGTMQFTNPVPRDNQFSGESRHDDRRNTNNDSRRERNYNDRNDNNRNVNDDSRNGNDNRNRNYSQEYDDYDY